MLLFPPVTTCVTIVFTFHMHCISIVKFLYFKTFLASFIMKLQLSINRHCRQTGYRCIILWSCSVFILWNKNCYLLSATDIWSSLISLLKRVAKYLCITVSSISQKFSLWPLPGAIQLSIVFSTIATSFFKYWPPFLTRILLVLLFDPLGFIIMLNIFPIYAFHRFCISSSFGAFFTLAFFCLRRL